MKVLQISSERTWRGGEQQIAYLIEELQKHQITVVVACLANSEFHDYGLQKRLTIIPFSSFSSFNVKAALKLKQLCREYEIDLIHVHNAKSHSVSVLAAAFGNSTPIVLSRRVVFQPKSSFLTKWKYNHPAIKKVICISGKVSEIMKSYLSNPDKTVTVFSGIDLNKGSEVREDDSLRRQYRLPQDAILIGNTGALTGEKDYNTFINTIGKLVGKKLPVHGVIIGKGSLENELKEYVANAGLSANITFTGFRKDVMQLLSELDIFLMTSIEEGLGTSILDAFLMRIPVVATRAGGIPEMVIHEETGLLAPIGDASGLASHIEKILLDESLRKRLINNASLMVKKFSKENMGEETITVYHNVLSK